MKNTRWMLWIFLGWLISFAGTSFAQTASDELRLKDYRPRSIYEIPRTAVEKSRYPVIDLHTHPYAKTPEEVAQWIKNLDAAGVEKCVIQSYTTGAEFDAILALYSKFPDRFEVWCGFDYTGYDKPGFGPASVAELERCVKAGAKGVGELGDKGKGLFYDRPTKAWGMHLDDPRMDPLLEKCAQLKLPVSIHVADPIWMYQPMDATNDGLMNALKWRLDDKKDIVGHSGMIDSLERAVQRHPRTTFIAVHFANLCYDLGRMGRLLDKYPNLYADNSARYAETGAIPRFTAKFYEKYASRILFGTDMGTQTEMYRFTFRILETLDEHFYAPEFSSYHWYLNGFGLPDPVLKKVYRENALKVFHQRDLK